MSKSGRDYSETGSGFDHVEQRHRDTTKQNDGPESGRDCCDGEASRDTGDFGKDEIPDSDISSADGQSTDQAAGKRVRIAVDFSVEPQAGELERGVRRDARPGCSVSTEARNQQQVEDNVCHDAGN